MSRRSCAAVLLGLALAVSAAPPASATMPGDNGRIAFNRGGDVYTAAADGKDVQRLTRFGGGASTPRWSPDGTQIAFVRGGSVWTMDADGSSQVRRVRGTAPSWSPDGTRLAYVGETSQPLEAGETCSYGDVLVLPLDGSRAPGGLDGFNAAAACSWGTDVRTYGRTTSWSPDGERVLYTYVQRSLDEYDGAPAPRVGVGESTVAGRSDRVLTTWAGDVAPPQADYAPARDNYVVATPAASADGRSRAYVHNRSGTYAKQVGAVGAEFPVHSPDGTAVLYSRQVAGGAWTVQRAGLGASTAAPVTVLTDASQPDWQPRG